MLEIRYGDIVISALQKALINHQPLNLQDLEQLKTDTRYSLYINQIPSLLNEALYILTSRGKPLIHTREIFTTDAYDEVDNDLYIDMSLLDNRFAEIRDVIVGNNKVDNNQALVRSHRIVIIDKRFFKEKVYIRYVQNPELVDMLTPMMQRLDIPREFGILAPLYIAAELAKEERPDLSVQYRNQFEAELGILKEDLNMKEQTDIYGWL